MREIYRCQKVVPKSCGSGVVKRPTESVGVKSAQLHNIETPGAAAYLRTEELSARWLVALKNMCECTSPLRPDKHNLNSKYALYRALHAAYGWLVLRGKFYDCAVGVKLVPAQARDCACAWEGEGHLFWTLHWGCPRKVVAGLGRYKFYSIFNLGGVTIALIFFLRSTATILRIQGPNGTKLLRLTFEELHKKDIFLGHNEMYPTEP